MKAQDYISSILIGGAIAVLVCGIVRTGLELILNQAEKAAVASLAYEPKYGDYVVIKKGFYRDFEGWIVGRDEILDKGTIKLCLNDRSLPGSYIKDRLWLKNQQWRRDQFEIFVDGDTVEPKPEPDKPAGHVELRRQVDQILAVVDNDEGAWAYTDPVEIDGRLYRVAVKCEGKK